MQKDTRQARRAVALLRGRDGASLMMVLGILLMLMIAGASVMAAASAHTGSALKQHTYNQARLLTDSVHTNIRHSLQSDPPGGLSPLLVRALLEAYDTGGYLPLLPLTLSLDNGLDIYSGTVFLEGVELAFTEQAIIMQEGADAVYVPVYDENGLPTGEDVLLIPRQPKTASVNAEMTVTVRVNANGMLITSRAAYAYLNGRLSDQTEEGVMTFDPGGFGEWRMISYEGV